MQKGEPAGQELQEGTPMWAEVWEEEAIFPSSSLKLGQQVDRGEERVCQEEEEEASGTVGLHGGLEDGGGPRSPAPWGPGVQRRQQTVRPHGQLPADPELLNRLSDRDSSDPLRPGG